MMIDRGNMETVTISPKFQVVIPRAIREELKLKPGQRVTAIRIGDRIELVPWRPMRTMRGFARGISTDVPRDDDRI